MSPNSDDTRAFTRRETLRASSLLATTGLAGCAAFDPDRAPSGSVHEPSSPPESPSQTSDRTATASRCGAGWDATVQWTTETAGEPVAPVVVGDAVFLFAETGTPTDVVYALDLASGRPRWTRELASVGGVLTAGGGRTYLNHSETLRALDATTGAAAWSTSVEDGSGFSTNPRYLAPEPPRSDGTPSRELLVVGVARHSTTERRVENPFDRVYAYDAASGAERWFVDLPWRPEGLAVTDGLAVAGTAKGMVHAIRTDGTERWRTDLGIEPCYSCLVAPPTVGPGTAFVVADEFLVALALDDGSESWRQDGIGRPAVLGETGIYCKLRGDGGPPRIGAFDPADGTPRWRTSIGGTDETVIRLGTGDGTVYVSADHADSATDLLAIDATDGCTVGRRTLDSEHTTAPVVGGDVLVVGSGDGSPGVSALDPPPGRPP